MAILLQRCPVCLDGKIFRSLLGSNKDCPVCSVHFERESGFYLSAMFIAYTLGFIIIAPVALYLYFQEASAVRFSIIIGGAILVLWPFIFRYSRVLWLHADQLMDPRRLSASDKTPSDDPA